MWLMIPSWRRIGLPVSCPSSEDYKAQTCKHDRATLSVSRVAVLYIRCATLRDDSQEHFQTLLPSFTVALSSDSLNICPG